MVAYRNLMSKFEVAILIYNSIYKKSISFNYMRNKHASLMLTNFKTLKKRISSSANINYNIEI